MEVKTAFIISKLFDRITTRLVTKVEIYFKISKSGINVDNFKFCYYFKLIKKKKKCIKTPDIIPNRRLVWLFSAINRRYKCMGYPHSPFFWLTISSSLYDEEGFYVSVSSMVSSHSNYSPVILYFYRHERRLLFNIHLLYTFKIKIYYFKICYKFPQKIRKRSVACNFLMKGNFSVE